MGLRELEQEADAAAPTMAPGVRGLLGVVRAVGAVLRVALVATLLLGAILGGAYGAQHGPLTLFLGVGLGLGLGFLPELLRRALLTAGYRYVLGRGDLQGLQAVGGTTSAALPSFTAPKSSSSSSSSSPAPVFVAPVRPPPRVGDPDAEDFDD